ncbi:META domain-containing protein [Falsigemmobacter faecalis]|uniref:META domain-containing protein n=1 Tax=Falsigemmobacter faecalis TaxID=2488730 RepID=A0A3P3DQJ4_9RHOB|nr:META domain-containing protein [Falsigemmobacter faecalis]RRH76421.1 META domain-containing protein [Falsigemmobacter faecalis]
MPRSLLPAALLLAFALPAFAQTAPPAAPPSPGPAAPALKLSGAEWKVTRLAALSAIEGEAPSLSFGKDARVSGASGCNRYMGGYTQDGQSLTFTELAGTMMACPPARMELEQRMLGALGEVTGFLITPGGALELYGAAGLLLRAER